MQIDCVLEELDWAEPMMQFLLHVICSCISHAYVLYFQYTCYIWNMFGAFLIVSFFPLSTLFTLIVFMAPKCKSTLSQNPLHSGALSSSDPTPSHIRFRDEDTRKDFSEDPFIHNINHAHMENYWTYVSHISRSLNIISSLCFIGL